MAQKYYGTYIDNMQLSIEEVESTIEADNQYRDPTNNGQGGTAEIPNEIDGHLAENVG